MDQPLPATEKLQSALACDFVRNVRDRALRDFDGYLRGTLISPKLKEQMDALGWGEAEMAVIWPLLFSAVDYSMHCVLDFVEYNSAIERLEIRIADEAGTYSLDTDHLPGRYIGWEEEYGQVSPKWMP